LEQKNSCFEDRVKELESYIEERRDWWSEAQDVKRNCKCKASSYYKYQL
jgi:hypothetical protein